MMISSETYAEEYLRGKSVEEIEGEIRQLKKEMQRLRRKLDDPDYRPMMYPSDDVVLSCDREYLEKAKEALINAGGTYHPTKTERQAELFIKRIPDICEIRFEISGFFRRAKAAITANLAQDPVTLTCERSGKLRTETMDKASFLEEFTDLHVEEWKRKNDVPTKTEKRWTLAISYGGKYRKVSYTGNRTFFGFGDLLDLLHYDLFYR